jgi:uncharacterized membrane protein
VEWDAAITDERPNEVIAWHSARDAQVHNTGSVRFHDAPGGRGTEVKVVLAIHAASWRCRGSGCQAVR